MATLNLKEETVRSLEQIASELGIASNTLAEKAIQQFLRKEATKKIAREEAAFRRQHAALLEEYEGDFVAMHNGRVIDHDKDEMALFHRIRQQYPQVGILIKQVTTSAEVAWQVRSPRWVAEE